jgi:type I restriction enzyme S subunit
MKLDLPAGWHLTTIGEICSYIQRGKSPKYAEISPLPVINQKCIRWNALETQHLKFIHPDQFSSWDSSRYICPNDILWNSTGTGTVGRAYLIQVADCDPRKVVDSHVTIVRPSVQVEARYVFNWIKGPHVQQRIEGMCDGTTNQIELSRTAISETQIPLPPIAEQKRIADKLDTLLSRVDACRERLDRVPTLIKRFKQSVLAAATSGGLTADWRERRQIENSRQVISIGEEEVDVPGGWIIKSLREVIDPNRPLCYGVVQPGDARSGGVPLIRVQDMENGIILKEGLRTVSEEIDADFKRSRVQVGDILISVVGTIGRTAVVPPGLNANIARAIAKISCIGGVNPHWLDSWLNTQTLQWWLLSSSKEVARKTLNLGDLALAKVAIPCPEEQTEIVRRVQSLFASVAVLESRFECARVASDRLTPSLLAKAFRGELVPQDPNDEPAQKMLERLRTAKSGEPIKATSRGRKRTATT